MEGAHRGHKADRTAVFPPLAYVFMKLAGVVYDRHFHSIVGGKRVNVTKFPLKPLPLQTNFLSSS
jgi:hypothetical protein